MKYFEIHVDVKESYSVYVKMETTETLINEDEVVNEAVKQGLIEKEDDESLMSIDYIEEVTEQEYVDMTGHK